MIAMEILNQRKELLTTLLLIVHLFEVTLTALPVCPYYITTTKEYYITTGAWKLLQNSVLLDWAPPDATVCETWTASELVNSQWIERSNDTCAAGENCALATTKTECQNGIPRYTYWQIESSNCWCGTSSYVIPIRMNDALSFNRRTICQWGYSNDTYQPLPNTKYQTCGRQVTCSDISSHSGPGCYCKSGYRLDLSSGHCILSSNCLQNHNSSPIQKQSFKLYAPSRASFNGTSRVISWTSYSNITMHMYNYTITSQDMVIASGIVSSNILDERRLYQVHGNVGQLTLSDEMSTVEGDYSVEVTAELSEEVTFIVETKEPSNNDLRLAHTLPSLSSSVINGALEIYNKFNMVWHLLCVFQWSPAETRVVCRQLGAAGNGSIALSPLSHYATMTTIPRWGRAMYTPTIRCLGNEQRLADCASVKFIIRYLPCPPANILQIECTIQ